MRYSISVTKRQRERIPLLLRSVGINHLQEPIRRPNDGERAVLRPGQIAVLEPHMKHGYQSSGGDWTVHYVGFEGDACIRILSCLKLSRSGVYSLSDAGLFLSHLGTMQELTTASKPPLMLCSKELYSLLLCSSTFPAAYAASR